MVRPKKQLRMPIFFRIKKRWSLFGRTMRSQRTSAAACLSLHEFLALLLERNLDPFPSPR